MPRAYARRTRRGTREAEMPPELAARLYDEPAPAGADTFLWLDLKFPTVAHDAKVWEGMTLAEVWTEYGETVLADWIAERPGTRPSLWWLFSAPRQPVGTYPGWFYDGTLPQPRKRLGGIGTAAHEVLAYTPAFPFGVPLAWIGEGDMTTWPSLAGRAEPVAADDPPLFESQAAYLDRLGLLLPGERERLTDDDFAAVPVDMPAAA